MSRRHRTRGAAQSLAQRRVDDVNFAVDTEVLLSTSENIDKRGGKCRVPLLFRHWMHILQQLSIIIKQ